MDGGKCRGCRKLNDQEMKTNKDLCRLLVSSHEDMQGMGVQA